MVAIVDGSNLEHIWTFGLPLWAHHISRWDAEISQGVVLQDNLDISCLLVALVIVRLAGFCFLFRSAPTKFDKNLSAVRSPSNNTTKSSSCTHLRKKNKNKTTAAPEGLLIFSIFSVLAHQSDRALPNFIAARYPSVRPSNDETQPLTFGWVSPSCCWLAAGLLCSILFSQKTLRLLLTDCLTALAHKNSFTSFRTYTAALLKHSAAAAASSNRRRSK